MSEASNSVLTVGYANRRTFRIRTEARVKIATWITEFHNARRLHSVCGSKSPIDHERVTTEPPAPRDWPHRSSPRGEGMTSALSTPQQAPVPRRFAVRYTSAERAGTGPSSASPERSP
ncbi:hypothetical protein ABZX77_52790 [Streptomyces sp. NPDC004237]|uniref:hypothetical protein n=1 Tax=Streptomyces sp. NPDC004237 TaxID=3154455 RepID=UPI0033AEC66A